jgi:hypothetical protein
LEILRTREEKVKQDFRINLGGLLPIKTGRFRCSAMITESDQFHTERKEEFPEDVRRQKERDPLPKMAAAGGDYWEQCTLPKGEAVW